MKNLAILGSTGSIGQNTLKIVEMFPDAFCVKALTAATSLDLLQVQILKFKPEVVAVIDAFHADQLAKKVKGVEILYGRRGFETAASLGSVDMVVAAMVGAAGLSPTLSGIAAGKDIALANKETLVMAGKIVMDRAAARKVRILPVDSEHSAIFQSLAGSRKEDMEKIFLTASGGPFLKKDKKEFSNITPQDALRHPNWQMGKKITIDSATLMNKGLEVIEASALFEVSVERIDVVVHPQSIVHSMVGFRDGSVIAQMGIPDMRSAIAYALSFPERMAIQQPLPDFPSIGALTFEKPDLDRFPCLGLALYACRTGGTLPAVMNAANEMAVQGFLDLKISFENISQTVEKIMNIHSVVSRPDVEDILAADAWAREETARIIHGKDLHRA
jgi:1-deoxy-D-xylulose-5-phosphate reductoisomerase